MLSFKGDILFLLFLISCFFHSKEEVAAEKEELCNDSGIVTELAKNLSEAQKDTASLIEEDFDSLQIPKNITAAAIVNAVAESKLKPELIGDHGASVGIFQLNKNGLGRKMSVEHRQDPHINTMVVGIQVLKNERLLRNEEAGATIPELTAIFTEEIMRPKNTEVKKEVRRSMAEKIFPPQIEECD